MNWPSRCRVTWAEVAEWMPDGEAEVAFDRDVAPTGMAATLYLRAATELGKDGLVHEAFELWAIDEEAPLIAHKHDVRVHALSFPEPVEVVEGRASPLPCRCRVWRGVVRGWCRPEDERAKMARRGTALYEIAGGRARLVR